MSEPSAPDLSRRRAALASLTFSYGSLGLGIVKALALVPYYLTYFDLTTYGGWLATGNVVGMLGGLEGGLGMVVAQRLAFHWGRGDRVAFRGTAGSGALMLGGLFALVALTGLLLAPWIPGFVNTRPSDVEALTTGFQLALAGSVLSLVRGALFSISSAWQRMTFSGSALLVTQLLDIVATVVALELGAGVASLGMGIFAASAITTVAALVYIGRTWILLGLEWPTASWATGLSLLKTTAPLTLSRLAGAVLSNAEATVTAALIDPKNAAALVLTGRVIKVAESVVNPIAGAVFSGLAHATGGMSAQRLRSTLTEIVALSALMAAAVFPLALGLNEAFVGLWVGPGAFGGWTLSMLLCVAAIITTRMNLLGMVLPALGDVSAGAVIGTTEFALRLPLMLGLIHWLGIIGAPIASITSALTVGLVYAGHRLGRRLAIGSRGGIRLATTGMLSLLVGLAAGVLASTLTVGLTWPRLCLEGALVATLTVALALATNTKGRVSALAVLSRLLDRARGRPPVLAPRPPRTP